MSISHRARKFLTNCRATICSSFSALRDLTEIYDWCLKKPAGERQNDCREYKIQNKSSTTLKLEKKEVILDEYITEQLLIR